MFNIGKVTLGKTTKRYTRKNQFDNNTTFAFGAVQPLFKQTLLPDTDISVNMRQLVRLAPMPVPTFGRVKLVNRAVFVPMVDVCPYYEAMLSGMSYYGSGSPTKAYVPTELVTIGNRELLYQVLRWCSCTVWKQSSSSSSSYVKVTDTATLDKLTPYFQYYMHALQGSPTSSSYNVQFKPNYINNNVDGYGSVITDVTSSSADFVIGFKYTENGSDMKVYYFFRMSDQAKRLRNILVGLGYNLDPDSYDRVSFLPILAFYKAWFDTYEVKRTTSWQSTNAYSLIKYIEEVYSPNLQGICNSRSTTSGTVYDIASLFVLFMEDLSNCFYVYDDDFVSVHRAALNNGVRTSNFPFVDGDGTSNSVLAGANSEPLLTLNQSTSSSKNSILYNVGLQSLQRLTRYVAKDSILGKRISDWVRTHFNADVANSLYQNVYNVGESVIPIQVNDVWSTSDTVQYDSSGVPSSGERLGAYGGKGIAFGDDTFKFHTDKHGFLIVLSAIVCDSRYFQGNDTDLYCWTRYTLPDPSFDALGYEVTPKTAIVGANGLADMSSSVSFSNTGFGFVPRYTGFKVKKDIINGDMSRRPTMDDLSPYYLDRVITTRSLRFTYNSSSKVTTVGISDSTVPNASQVWRYMGKYPWLGNFNRIFYNSNTSLGEYSNPNQAGSVYDSNDDNFIVQTLCDMTIQDQLKPISQSFDTFEESTDNATTAVNPE